MTPDEKRKRLILMQMQAQKQPAKSGIKLPEPDIAAMLTPGMSEEALAGIQADVDERNIAANPIASRAAKFYQGLPVVGEYTDEAVGALFGEEQAQGMRLAQGAMDRQRPGQAMALEIAGGITGSAPLVALAAPSIAGTATGNVAAQTLLATGTGMLAAGSEGAVSGYGRGENQSERVANAKNDGVAGALIGGTVSAAAPLVSKTLKSAVEYFKKSDVRRISRELGVTSKAAKVIKGHLENDDLEAARKVLKATGKDAMLADASPGSAQLLDTAMSTGGAALKTGRDAVEDRAAKSANILTKRLDAVLGDVQGKKAVAKGIAKRTSAARSAAYDRAFSQPIDYSTTGRAVEDVLDRVPPKTLNAAISEANEAMQEAGLKNLQILADIADDGSVAFREMPNVRQLHELKIALGNIAKQNIDDFGRLNAKGIRYNRLAGDLRGALKGAVPSYGKALKLGGDKIAEDNALRLGRDVLSARVKREDVAEAMTGASEDAVVAFKKGLRGAIDDAMATVKSAASDPNIDAREARKLITDLSSRANRTKITEAIGATDAKRIFKVLNQEGLKMGTKAAVARNSATASRLAGKEAIRETSEGGILEALQSGEPVNAAKRLIQAMTGRTPAAKAKREAGLMAEIASLLTNARGEDAERALVIVQSALDGQPVTEAAARQISNAVTNVTLTGAYQTGTQLLERP